MVYLGGTKAASTYNSSVTSIWAELLIILTPSFYITNLY